MLTGHTRLAPLKERYKAQINYHINKCRVTYIVKCCQCQFIDLQVHSEHKQAVSSVYHVKFCFKHYISGMLSIVELYQQ
jgi:hypothetical protein